MASIALQLKVVGKRLADKACNLSASTHTPRERPPAPCQLGAKLLVLGVSYLL